MLRWFSLLLGVLVLASTLPAADPEPTLDGKPLAEWLDLLRKGGDAANPARRTLYRLPDLTNRAMSPLVDSLLAGEEPRRAVDALAALGSSAARPLARVLQRGGPGQQVAALFALAQMGRSARVVSPAVARYLNDPEPLVRAVAVRALGKIDPNSADLVRPLLRDSEPRVQAEAIRALIRLGVSSSELMPHLQEWLKAEGESQFAALELLADLGPEAGPATAGLVRTVASGVPEKCRPALECLFNLGPAAGEAVPALKTLLADPRHADLHLNVAQTLWRIRRSPEAVAAFKTLAQDAKSPHRTDAAYGWWIAAREATALEVLVEIAQGKNARQADHAISCLRQIGSPAARVAVDPLCKLLEKAAPEQADGIFRALGNFGEAAQPAAEIVAAHARERKDENLLARFTARDALLQIRPDADSVRLYSELIQKADADDRGGMVRRLGENPGAAEVALPALRRMLDDPEPRVSLAAAVLLWRHKREPRALEVATARLSDPSAEVRSTAALELGYYFGADALPAVPALIERLWDDDSFVRSSAAENLGRIGPGAKAAVPALVALLQDDAGDDLHSVTAEALGLIGPEAKAAVPILKKRLQFADSYTRACAGLALWHIAKDATTEKTLVPLLDDRNFRARVVSAEALWRQSGHPRAVPVLLEVLRGTDFAPHEIGGNQAFMAIRALGRIGPKAAEALPDIRARLVSEDWELRRTATTAIRLIEGK